jgi:hypothetical protein
VEQFADEADRVLASYALQGQVAVEVLLRHLEGQARAEILNLPAARRNTPALVLQHLRANFADTRPLSALLTAFHGRVQRQGESLMAFSHALANLAASIRAKDPNAVGANTVRDRFSEGVADLALRRCLQEQLETVPATTLEELRRKATRWAREEEAAVVVQQQHQASSQEMGAMRDQMSAMMESMTAMNAAMKMLLQERAEPNRRLTPEQRAQMKRGECFACGRRGHRAAQCPGN